MESDRPKVTRGIAQALRRYAHWIILVVIVGVLGMITYHAYKLRDDPLNLFPSLAQDYKQARNRFITIVVIAIFLAIVEERRWRRRRSDDSNDADGESDAA